MNLLNISLHQDSDYEATQSKTIRKMTTHYSLWLNKFNYDFNNFYATFCGVFCDLAALNPSNVCRFLEEPSASSFMLKRKVKRHHLQELKIYFDSSQKMYEKLELLSMK